MTEPDHRIIMELLKTESDMRISLMVRINQLEAELLRMENIMLAWQESARAFSRGALNTGEHMRQNALFLMTQPIDDDPDR